MVIENNSERSNDRTPLTLVYGSEALLPGEIRVQTIRVKHLNQE